MPAVRSFWPLLLVAGVLVSVGFYPWADSAEEPSNHSLPENINLESNAGSPDVDLSFSRESDKEPEAAQESLVQDWRERPELVAHLQAAYLEARNLVDELDGPWYANEKIGSKAMAQIEEHPNFREIVPAPDVGFLRELPERDLNEAAHLLRDTIILNWSLGSRPYAPYADKSMVKETLGYGARAYSVPVTTLLQDIVGRERFDWPANLMQEAGMMRDQAIFHAAHPRAMQIACQSAAVMAVERVGLQLEDFHTDQDLPQLSTEYKAAIAAQDDLSERYLEDIRDLVARYAEEEDSGANRWRNQAAGVNFSRPPGRAAMSEALTMRSSRATTSTQPRLSA